MSKRNLIDVYARVRAYLHIMLTAQSKHPLANLKKMQFKRNKVLNNKQHSTMFRKTAKCFIRQSPTYYINTNVRWSAGHVDVSVYKPSVLRSIRVSVRIIT